VVDYVTEFGESVSEPFTDAPFASDNFPKVSGLESPLNVRNQGRVRQAVNLKSYANSVDEPVCIQKTIKSYKVFWQWSQIKNNWVTSPNAAFPTYGMTSSQWWSVATQAYVDYWAVQNPNLEFEIRVALVENPDTDLPDAPVVPVGETLPSFVTGLTVDNTLIVNSNDDPKTDYDTAVDAQLDAMVPGDYFSHQTVHLKVETAIAYNWGGLGTHLNIYTPHPTLPNIYTDTFYRSTRKPRGDSYTAGIDGLEDTFDYLERLGLEVMSPIPTAPTIDSISRPDLETINFTLTVTDQRARVVVASYGASPELAHPETQIAYFSKTNPDDTTITGSIDLTGSLDDKDVFIRFHQHTGASGWNPQKYVAVLTDLQTFRYVDV
jgi:hypothetical protein